MPVRVSRPTIYSPPGTDRQIETSDTPVFYTPLDCSGLVGDGEDGTGTPVIRDWEVWEGRDSLMEGKDWR